MWQRFTERARKAVYYAQEEAQRFGEGYVSTEFLLLGLVRETDSVAFRVLEKLALSPNRIRAEVEKQLPRGNALPSRDMTLTPRAKRVIDLAYDEARNLSNNYIGSEHLLLGLVREGDGLAARILCKLGAEIEAVRSAVIDVQNESGGAAEPVPRAPSLSEAPRTSSSGGMWQRFTEMARRTIFHAQDEAQRFGEGYVSTEHLLLGLLRETESVGVRAVECLGVSASRLRAEVEKRLTERETRSSADMTITPRAKRVIDLAYDEARQLSNNYIGTEHLLLGLIRESDGIAGQAFAATGVELEAARKVVMVLQDAEPRSDPPKTEAPDVESAVQARLAASPSVGFAYVIAAWDQLDRSAQAAILQAQLEAQLRGKTDVGPDDLLLGLLKSPGAPLAGLLTALGHTPSEAVALIESEQAPPQPRLHRWAKFTRESAAAIGHALEEAGERRPISGEHLLLGLLKDPEDTPARVFTQLGVTIEQVRAAIRESGV